MFPNPADEWRALSEQYHRMVDEELLELAAAFHDLTPTAQQALRDEMRLRKLGDPQWGTAESRETVHEEAVPPGDAPVEYTWKTPLCECDTREQAWQISEMLRRAGIESWVEASNRYTPLPEMEFRHPQVLVPADQLEQARAVAAQPIPADIVEQSQMVVPEYAPPACPRCGAADPVLEDVDPVNSWSCEACGASWSDPPAEPGPEEGAGA